MGDFTSIFRLLLKVTMLSSLSYLVYLGLPIKMPGEEEGPSFSNELAGLPAEVEQKEENFFTKVDRAMRAPASVIDRMFGGAVTRETGEQFKKEDIAQNSAETKRSRLAAGKGTGPSTTINSNEEGKSVAEDDGGPTRQDPKKLLAELPVAEQEKIQKQQFATASAAAKKRRDQLTTEDIANNEATSGTTTSPTPICPSPVAQAVPAEGMFGNEVASTISLNISGQSYYCIADQKDKAECNSLDTSTPLPCDPMPAAGGTLYTGAINIDEFSPGTPNIKKGRCLVFVSYGCGQWSEKKTALYYIDKRLPNLSLAAAPVLAVQSRELWDKSNFLSYQSTDFGNTWPQRQDIFSYQLNFSSDPFAMFNISQIVAATSAEDDGLIQTSGSTEYLRLMFAAFLPTDTIMIPYKFSDGALNGIEYGTNYFVTIAVNPKLNGSNTSYLSVPVVLEDFTLHGLSVGGGAYTQNASGVNVIEGEFASYGQFEAAPAGKEGRAPASVGADIVYLESDIINIIN